MDFNIAEAKKFIATVSNFALQLRLPKLQLGKFLCSTKQETLLHFHLNTMRVQIFFKYVNSHSAPQKCNISDMKSKGLL